MNNREAAEILRAHKVDSSFDTREPTKILEFLLSEGHLDIASFALSECLEPIAVIDEYKV